MLLSPQSVTAAVHALPSARLVYINNAKVACSSIKKAMWMSARPDTYADLPHDRARAPFLPSLAAMLRVAPGQALARAHTLAAYDQVSTEELGRLRAGPDIARRMAGLSDLLTRRSEAPALVLAAVAHAEVATAVPFGSADVLVARAVERMVLISSGFDPPGVIATEVGHEHRAEDYRRLLRAYASGTIDGVRQWILHVATAAVDGAAVGVGKERLSPAE